MNGAIALLHETPILAGLEERTLTRLAGASALVEVPPETDLFRRGEQAAWLHLILRGLVALTTSTCPSEAAVIEILAPGEFFVLAAVLLRAPYAVAARSLRTARLLRIDAVQLRDAAADDPGLAQRLTREVARQYRCMLDQVADLKLRSAPQRLARHLVALIRGPMTETAEVYLPYDKRLLAARLAMQPEHLSRAFATLRRHGVVTHGLYVRIADPARLAAFAAVDGDM